MTRFSLRDTFWLTLVVGLALGWYLDRGRYRSAIHESTRWRGAAINLGSVMESDGWKVNVRDFDGASMSFDAAKEGRTFRIGKHSAREISGKPAGKYPALSSMPPISDEN